ncbi:MAG: hypothetical protein OJF52_000458 [Nitrospira sp.]|nr:MAG: hypothetical protein OJF52_000458 [Nitrospira sp.]
MPLKIFISYAHEDRDLKDELLAHLSGVRRRGLIQPWDDDLIEVGSQWHNAIVKAMKTCHIALLLISRDFLKSDFIQSIELKHLLARKDVSIIPVIVRPCAWEEEAIGELQVLPEQGKAVIAFSDMPGGRDVAWTFIVRHLERVARENQNGVRRTRSRLDEADCRDMAGSADPAARELAAQSINDFYDEDPDAAKALLKTLLQTESEEVRRTALKAAYYIGSPARDIFLWIAEADSVTLRQTAMDVLYLIWQREPDFAYALLHDLLEPIRHQLDLVVRTKRKFVEFFVALTISIYINNCHREDVKLQTAELYHKLAKEKLRLQTFHALRKHKFIENLVLLPVRLAFAKPILETLLYTDLQPAEHFFRLPVQEKACLKRLVPVIEMRTGLDSVCDDLVRMLQSEILFFNHSAALAIAVQAHYDLSKSEPVLRWLFDNLNARGRLWELFGFSILFMHRAPRDFLKVIEDLTDRMINENADIFHDDRNWLSRKFDIMFLPLGLAYGKCDANASMPVFNRVIQEGLKGGSYRIVARCIRALGPVGFYYPQAVFCTFANVPMRHAEIKEAVIEALATIRTLHFDAVDSFIREAEMEESVRRRISAAADVALVRSYIYKLGHYNNAVHQSLFYPKMRRAFIVNALNCLADALTPGDFIRFYTSEAFRMAHEADFNLIEWTRQD